MKHDSIEPPSREWYAAGWSSGSRSSQERLDKPHFETIFPLSRPRSGAPRTDRRTLAGCNPAQESPPLARMVTPPERNLSAPKAERFRLQERPGSLVRGPWVYRGWTHEAETKLPGHVSSRLSSPSKCSLCIREFRPAESTSCSVDSVQATSCPAAVLPA
jgi:hypothetical protein